MKRAGLFLSIWFMVAFIPSWSVNWYSNGLYKNFIHREASCIASEAVGGEEAQQKCLIENILKSPAQSLSDTQLDIVVLYKKAAEFNLTLLYVVFISFILGAPISWYVVYKYRRIGA